MYSSAVTRHCKAAVTPCAAVMKRICFMWFLELPLWLVNVFLAAVCAGRACFPGCYCSSMSETERWSSDSCFPVVQDALCVSHLQRSTSCPSQWLPFEPTWWINILYTVKGSIFKTLNGQTMQLLWMPHSRCWIYKLNFCPCQLFSVLMVYFC